MKRTHFLLLSLCVVFTACNNLNKTDSGETSKQDSSQTVVDKEKEFKFLNIIANIPSPTYEIVEIAKAGEKINAALCNSIDNVDKYQSSYKLAINYGVYTSDLAYMSAFNQKQDVLKYFAATRTLAEKNGVVSTFDKITKEGHFEENIGKSVDSLENVINKLYTGIDEFLVNDHHLDIASKILVGSWIEAQYLALQHLKESKSNRLDNLFNKLWEQKLHLSNINILLEEFSDHEQLKEIASDLKSFYEMYYAKAVGVESFKNKDTLVKMANAISLIRDKVVNP